MTLVERMARAISDAEFTGIQPVTDHHRRDARAALKAMREPTEAMLTAGGNEGGFDGYRQTDNTADIWRAMIDAALTEQ